MIANTFLLSQVYHLFIGFCFTFTNTVSFPKSPKEKKLLRNTDLTTNDCCIKQRLYFDSPLNCTVQNFTVFLGTMYVCQNNTTVESFPLVVTNKKTTYRKQTETSTIQISVLLLVIKNRRKMKHHLIRSIEENKTS